jgi:hypothetical protein
MVEPLVWTETRQRMCNICGALVGDIDMHAGWHKGGAVPEQPAPAPDPWQDEVAAIFLGESAGRWDQLFDRAVRHTLSAMLEHGTNDEEYRASLVHAAARVRAMVPDGAVWEQPWQVSPGTERNTLRSVIRSLVHADTKHGPSPADTAGGLVAAESYLHGLWLAAVEEK